jgi:c-di-GMP-binding flagellar brake protein YcgR
MINKLIKRTIKKEDKRRYKRVSVYKLAKYRLLSNPEQPLMLAWIKDMSAGGVCLRLDEPIENFSPIQLHINFLEFDTPVLCVCKVAWVHKLKNSKGYEAGLLFIEIEEKIRQRIKNNVDFVDEKIQEEKNRHKIFFTGLLNKIKKTVLEDNKKV